RSHPDRLAGHAALAKKVSWAKHGDHRLFSGPIHHGEFYAALLDIHDAIRCFTLRVNRFASSKFCNFSRYPCGVEEHLRVERIGNSILGYLFGFHFLMEAPYLQDDSAPASNLTSRPLLKLSKRRHSEIRWFLPAVCNFAQTTYS